MLRTLRPSPSTLFVLAVLAVGGTAAVVGARQAHGATDGDLTLPSDAASFGFVVRGSGDANGVALLTASRAFTIKLANGVVRGEPPAIDRFTVTSSIVRRELARYPASFLRRVHVSGVVVTEDLTENETAIPSLPNVGGLLLLDARATESDLVRVLHHELFHFFDLADDGRLSPDDGWAKLNAPGFVYGAGGRSLRASWTARTDASLRGFVSGYATSGVEEDKAETFAIAMTRPAVLARQIAQGDLVLAAKRDEIWNRLERFDPDAAARLPR